MKAIHEINDAILRRTAPEYEASQVFDEKAMCGDTESARDCGEVVCGSGVEKVKDRTLSYYDSVPSSYNR